MVRSIIFRIILVLAAVYSVLFIDGIFPNCAYFSSLVLYLIVYIILRRHDLSLIRMLWDFALINFISWGRPIGEPIVFFMMILPMINAVNFSGKKRHSLILLSLTIGTMLVNIGAIEYWIILPVCSLFVLYLISMIKNREMSLDDSITKKVDEYFLSPVKLKSYEIYKSIIGDLNNYFQITENNGIWRIRVYTLKDDTMWLVNASSFMWERLFRFSNTDVELLKKNKRLVYKQDNGMALFYYIPKYEIEYVFVCDIKGEGQILFRLWGFNTILLKAFSKMSMLLNTEYRIAQRREENFNEIKDRVRYVNQAVRVMHFIRNKMTPLLNVIAFHKMESGLSPELKQTMKSRFSKEVNRADTDLKDILKYADDLLDESKNPFGELKVDEIPISKIFIILSELAQSQLEIEVETDESITSKTQENERVVHFNITNCKIMFTDWIANMRKNEGVYNFISLTISDEQLTAHFENTYSIPDDDAKRLIRDINSTAKDAVLEGKDYGHGIYYIKEIARDYGINIKSSSGKNPEGKPTIILDFKIKTHERKENTDI